MNDNTSVWMSQEDCAMANLRQFVIDQYYAAPPQVQSLAHQFFNAMDRDGDGSVDYSEFKCFLISEGLEYYAGRNLFIKLDGDGNRGLDFWEVMTLYYIIKSGRPFCFRCDNFLWDVYSACNDCGGGPLYFCNNCYQCHLQDHKFSLHQEINWMQPTTSPSLHSSETSNANAMTMDASGGDPNSESSSDNSMVTGDRSLKDRGITTHLQTAYHALEAIDFLLDPDVADFAINAITMCSIM